MAYCTRPRGRSKTIDICKRIGNDLSLNFRSFFNQRRLVTGEVNSMTKAELIDAVANSAKISKLAAGDAVDATFDSIAKAIKKSKRFQVPGFGTFTVRSRKARKGRNPQTGAPINIRASRTVGFKAAPVLKKGL
jgi:DNA-binding protein HU-beta